MSMGIVAHSWRSIFLRILLLSLKLYLLLYVTPFQAGGGGDGLFGSEAIAAITASVLGLIVIWNIVWITGVFKHSLRVYLIFHLAEIVILSFSATCSPIWPANFVCILLSTFLFTFKLGDAFSTPSHSNALRGQFTLFHPYFKDKPRWELALQRIGGNTQLRIYGSRVLVALAALDLTGLATSTGADQLPIYITLGVLLIHHLLSFFVTPLLHKPPDLFLCAVEVSPLLSIIFTSSYIWGFGVGPCIILVHWIIFTTRIWDLIVEPPISRFQRFDLINTKENIGDSPRVTLLLGRKAWDALSLKGEHRAVKFTRAVLAILVMGALLIFASLLIQRAIDTSSHENAFNDFTELYDRTQVLERLLFPIDPDIVPIAAGNITQRCWSGYTALCQADTKSESKYADSVLCKLDLSALNSSELEMLSLSCETRVELDFGYFDTLQFPVPDLFRAVNIQAVGVNTTRSEVSRLPSITLRQHENLVGDANVIIRENFRSTTGLNAFGFGGSFKRISVAQFPLLQLDELYPKGNTSSLRFFTLIPQYGQSDDLTLQIVREYNNHSVLGVFADLGGIWTFVNGVFALIFGGSLLYFLFGIKPLSRFGIVHFIFRQRLRRGTRENYPRFFEEGGQPGQPDAGVVAFIREHLLGVISDDQPSRSYMAPDSSTPLEDSTSDIRSLQKSGSSHTLSTRHSRNEGDERNERIPLEPLRYNS
ncbi:hypothetical protein DL96DRAFT_1823107 [Flagelloscypha sp. PMI_526]|nr:hypothetical protein DL96DRAFT_1823107 [Flagelloscypha sp. PMI_526]